MGPLRYKNICKFMQSKRLSKQKLLIIALVLFVLSIAFLFNLFHKRSISNISTSSGKVVVPLPIQTQSSFGLPVRLKIQKINVETTIEYVGRLSSGEMDVPKETDNVAWYEPGIRPGDKGSAVLAGHYGRWENGNGSVFDNLNALIEGDSLSVEDEKGAIINFVVRELRTYQSNDDASDVFESNDDIAHLNLITCAGVWNEVDQSYSERLVVFSDKVE